MQLSLLLSSISFSSMNPSSVFLAAGVGISNIFMNIIEFVLGLVYAIVKWILYLVDIVFSYVQQLAGLNMRWDSLDALFSGDTDMVFNLLWSAKDTVVPIVRMLIVIAIVLIVVFSIISIAKTSFESLKGTGQNQTASVLKTTFKAFVLMLLTPMIAIVGIVASNAILQALYNATNISGAVSLSSQIFSASSMSANSFRVYANKGERIPIMYDFSREDEIVSYYDGKLPTSEFINYLNSTDNITYATYLMFNFQNFIPYSSLNNIVGDATDDDVESFYSVYDVKKGLNEYESSTDRYKRIETYKEEYYVMADMVDYCVKTTTPVYYKTIEQVLTSIVTMSSEQKNRIFDRMVAYFGIKFLNSSLGELSEGTITADNFLTNFDWVAIRWTSDYMTGSSADNPDKTMQIQYTHLRNPENNDEIEGAKYIISSERTVTNSDGVVETYFYPFTVGDEGSYNTKFDSSHIRRGQMISAKGIFQDGIYPTAIKQNEANEVQFYRDEIESSMVGLSGSLATFSLQMPNGGGFFSKIVRFFRALFDPASLIPKFDMNLDAVTNSYSASIQTVNSISGGKLHISYMFGDVVTTGLLKSNYVLNLKNLYQPLKINYLILVMGALILIKVSLSAVFLLINRAYELFLIIIVYPTACATIPLDNGGYETWVKSYMGRLFATYGVLLGLNFVLMLFPVINSIQFFDPATVSSNLQIRRVGALFFAAFSVNEVTNMLNFVVSILFELVALTMLSDKNGAGVTKLISDVAGKDQNGEDPIQNFVSTIANVGKVMTMPMKVAGTAIKGASTAIMPSKRNAFMKKMKDKALSSLPGSAIVTAGKDKIYSMKKWSEQHNAKKDLKEALDSKSSSKEEVEQKMNDYLNKQKAYTKTLENVTDARKSNKDKKIEEKKNGVASREDDNPEEAGLEEHDMSKRALKRANKRSEKYVKRLEKKAKRKGLNAEEQKTLDVYKQRKENTKSELKSRKEQKKQLKHLNRKLMRHQIDEEQYAEMMEEKLELKARNAGIGQRAKKKEKEKEFEQRKQQEKQQQFQSKNEHYFRHTNLRARRKQNKLMKKLDKQQQNLEKDLQNEGIDYSSMDEIDEKISNNKFSQSQIEKIERYKQAMKTRQKWLGISESEYQAQSSARQQEIERKQAKIAGYDGNSLRKIRKHNKAQNRAFAADSGLERVKEIDTEIADLKSDPNRKNVKKMRKLFDERAKLQAEIGASETWTKQENGEVEAGPTKKEAKERAKIEEQAVNYLQANGEPVTTENVEKYVQNVLNSKKKNDDE